jgi:hypothetical protein
MRPGQSPSSTDAKNSRHNLAGGSRRRQGQVIHSTGSQFTIGRIIDAASDKVLHEWKAHNDWTYTLAIGPQGRLATGDWSGEVKLWMVKGSKVTRQHP